MQSIKLTKGSIDVILAEASHIEQTTRNLTYDLTLLREITQIITGGDGYKTLTESERLTRIEYGTGLKSLDAEYQAILDIITKYKSSLAEIDDILEDAGLLVKE